ncbi:hypothetical protein SAMD00019534_009420, partial [Acytostelium subglobosum LB1]|uniref:hypothetical protein n=1 Tax=Acytostelium subglobosum LB1 TaxID=1410327 RepID=UPI0006450875
MNITTLSILFIVVYLVLDFIHKNKKLSKYDPPGATALSLLGNLHQIGSQPHKGLENMAKKFGPVFRFWIGDRYAVVLSDPNIIKEINVKQFDNFTYRAISPTFDVMSRWSADLTLARDERWHHVRKLMSNAFTKTKLRAYTIVIDEQLDHLMLQMNNFMKNKQPFYPRKYLHKYSLNMILSMMYSEEIPQEEGQEGRMATLFPPMEIILKQLGTANLGDYINILRPLRALNYKIFGSETEKLYQISEKIYIEHVETLMRISPRDLLDNLIIDSKGEEDKESVIIVCNHFLMAGSDTCASTVEIFMFMINNPDIQEEMATELARVVGKGNRASVEHRPECPISNAVIKEVMRIIPVAPLSLPRQAKESIIIADKYFIPKGAMVINNHRAVHHNTDHWDHPEKFMPQRFLDDGETHNDFLLPFSSGPRNCVGQNLAIEEVFVACANNVHAFKLNSIDGKPVNEDEVFGLTIQPNLFQVCLEARS